MQWALLHTEVTPMPTVSGERLSLSLRVSKARCTRSNASSALSLQQQQSCTKAQRGEAMVGVVVGSGGGGENGGIFQDQIERGGQNSTTALEDATQPVTASAASRHTISLIPPHVPPYAAPTGPPPLLPLLAGHSPVRCCQQAGPHEPHASAPTPAVNVRHLTSRQPALQV